LLKIKSEMDKMVGCPKKKTNKGQGTYPKGLVRLNRREHKGIRGLKGNGLLVKG